MKALKWIGSVLLMLLGVVTVATLASPEIWMPAIRNGGFGDIYGVVLSKTPEQGWSYRQIAVQTTDGRLHTAMPSQAEWEAVQVGDTVWLNYTGTKLLGIQPRGKGER